MIREAVEELRERFYEYPKNPVKLNDNEEYVKSLMPRKEDVINKRAEPITIKELKERAEEEFGLRQDTARKKAYLLRKMGVADKNGNEWARTDRYRRLSKDKLRNFFIGIATMFAVLSFLAGNPWLFFFSVFFLVILTLIFS